MLRLNETHSYKMAQDYKCIMLAYGCEELSDLSTVHLLWVYSNIYTILLDHDYSLGYFSGFWVLLYEV